MAFIVDFYLFSLFPPSLLLLDTALHAHAIVPLSSPKCSSLVMARFSRYLVRREASLLISMPVHSSRLDSKGNKHVDRSIKISALNLYEQVILSLSSNT
jgi:hypothetical protein